MLVFSSRTRYRRRSNVVGYLHGLRASCIPSVHLVKLLRYGLYLRLRSVDELFARSLTRERAIEEYGSPPPPTRI